VVRVFGVNAPMPSQTVEAVVQPAHYAQELKQQARAHRAHALLFSAGTVTDPLEEYVALAVVAGVLAKHGAIVVTNEEARTSRPADTPIAGRHPGDSLALLRALPLLVLYCGLVKYGVEGTEGVWMRTYGVHRLGMPDLAALMAGHHQGQHYFTMFQNIYAYLRQTGAKFAAGHTANIGNDFIRLREPAEAEYFLQSPGGLFVVERVRVQ
jgi:hypothetical protein